MTEPQPVDEGRAALSPAGDLRRAVAAISSIVERSGGRVVAVCIDGVPSAPAVLATTVRPVGE